MTKRQKGWPLGNAELVIGVILLGMVTGLAVLVLRPGTAPAAREVIGQKPVAAVLGQLGTTMVSQGYEMRVLSTRNDAEGAPGYIPGTDRQYRVVELEIRNTGSASLPLAPVIQTFLRDSRGNIYTMAPAPMANPLVAGDLAVGETRQGELSYNVPVDAVGLRLTFDTSSPGVAPVTVDLGQ